MPNPKKPRRSCPVCGKEVARPEAQYCSNRCHREQRYLDYIAKWKAGEVSGNINMNGDGLSYNVRRYMFEKYGSRCSKCGWREVNPYTGLVPLTVEHKDGNWKNSSEDNLDLICPNCHALTATYGARNKGNGRPYRQIMRSSKEQVLTETAKTE